MDSDSDSEIELENEKGVDVGLIDLDLDEMTSEELKSYRIHLRSPFFPSKVGGKPAWLDYSHVPLAVDSTADKTGRVELKCNSCKSQLAFLLQIYAPIIDTDENIDHVQDIDGAFHRSLYVFICSSQSCASRGLKVLRSQLARENEFFSYDPPPSQADLPDDNNNDQLEISRNYLKQFYKKLYEKGQWSLCSVCGVSSSKKCSKCNFTYYCTQAHQLHDWTKLNHKNLCSRYEINGDLDELMNAWIEDENSERVKKDEQPSSQSVFPEHEIIIEPELLEAIKQANKAKDYKIDEKRIKEELESNQGLDQDLDALKENDYDKDFEKFKLRSAHESTQVIRYDRGGEPLWCTKYNKLTPKDVPACEHCGAKRIFEFQVTPQLLNYLNLDEGKQLLNTLDWAGLYVYTCVRSCQAANNTYTPEFIYKQDFVS